MFFQIWGVVAGILVLAFSLREWKFLFRFRLLREQTPFTKENFEWPSVSLIVPACNEVTTIENALKSLLKIDYPNLELIVIDDRSTDGTDRVIKSLQEQDSRIQLVQVTELPDGWLGKVHALHQGVERAKSEWLLFSDADVHHSETSLRKAITYIQKEKLDFLSVVPAVHAHSLILRSFIAQFYQTAVVHLDLQKLKDPQSNMSVGGGAFNLVSRAAYDRSKGFDWLKLEVIDDLALGFIVKQAGGRCDVLGGLNEIELEWYPTAGAFLRGLEKNGFAVVQYSVVILSLYLFVNIALFLGLVVAPLLSGSLSTIIFVGFSVTVYVMSSYAALKKLLPYSPWPVVFLPLTNVIAPLIVLRSTLLVLIRGGIYWRGTFYTRTELAENQRFKLFSFAVQKTFEKDPPSRV